MILPLLLVIVLTEVALLTGSIFPCILLHAGNNAFEVWTAWWGLPLAALEVWICLAALVAFLLSFYTLWRMRSPYPGIRYR